MGRLTAGIHIRHHASDATIALSRLRGHVEFARGGSVVYLRGRALAGGAGQRCCGALRTSKFGDEGVGPAPIDRG